jgi:hypothetical protein
VCTRVRVSARECVCVCVCVFRAVRDIATENTSLRNDVQREGERERKQKKEKRNERKKAARLAWG